MSRFATFPSQYDAEPGRRSTSHLLLPATPLTLDPAHTATTAAWFVKLRDALLKFCAATVLQR
jgi:hypothetical protein